MEYAAKNLDWSANAGRRLDLLARALPPTPSLEIIVRPALQRQRHDAAANPDFNTKLANAKMPDKTDDNQT
jgi:hypothetical protein